MLILRGLLVAAGVLAFAGAALRTLRDGYRRRRSLDPPEPGRLRSATILALLGTALVLGGAAVVVVPGGHAGVRYSQISGVRPGTLYPGIHVVNPLFESVTLYDVRDRLMSAGDAKNKTQPLKAQSREGLVIGLVLGIRYRLDAARLDYIQAALPADIDGELVQPAVATTFREVLPQYLVRDIFAARREEIRQKAADMITKRLAGDGILVKEVSLRDIVLPPEYARGLEALLLKEQANDQLDTELQIKQKQVRQAELEAEADKVREVKAAEAQAQVHVLQAKAEADAMQHTLPLKEKQIQQARLEADARKETTLKDAQAQADASVIKGKGEAERDRLMADVEANRIRVTGAADSERMRLEAEVLKDNPLLIQKIVAERLSDKMQIMMVPMDGHNFFANDIFRSMPFGGGAAPAERTPAPSGAVKSASRR
jgi:regulator of protease activity HflC (stomatin/prohibitin superfamily)